MNKYKNKKITYNRGFTLIELVIIVVILSILATLAFVSFKSYAKNSRDSNRVVTINNIQKGLELNFTKSSEYFTPEEINGTGVINGKVLTYVGVLGDNISRNIDFQGAPTDPLSKSKYMYGVSFDKKYFQVSGVSEEVVSSNLLISKTYAAGGNKAIVKGNYKGIIKYQSGSTCVSNVPSILFSTGGTANLLDNNIGYIVNKGANLPFTLDSSTSKIQKNTSEILSSISNTGGIAVECKTNDDWKVSVKISSKDLETKFGYNIDQIGEGIFKENYKGIIAEGDAGLFKLSKTEVSQGDLVTIIDNCKTSPTSFISSNSGIASITNKTITTLSGGTVTITPLGGDCINSSISLTVFPRNFELSQTNVPAFKPILYNSKIYYLSTTKNIVSFDTNTGISTTIYSLPISYFPAYRQEFVNVGSKLFFRMGDDTYSTNYKIFGYDISSGTGINLSGVNAFTNITNLFSYGDKLYFTGNDGTYGIELWSYDPNTTALSRLTNINTSGDSFSTFDIAYFTPIGNKIYFKATDGSNPFRVWYYDTSNSSVNYLTGTFYTFSGSNTGSPIISTYGGLSDLGNGILGFSPNYSNKSRIAYYDTNINKAIVTQDDSIGVGDPPFILIGNDIYFIYSNPSNSSIVNLYKYDKIANSYSGITNYPSGNYVNSWNQVLAGGNIFFTAKETSVSSTKSYIYNPNTSSVTEFLPGSYTYLTEIGDSVYYVYSNKFYRYKK